MHLNSHHSEQRQRPYPLLSIFDVTLNFVLCSGVLALGCAILWVALSRVAPQTIAQVCQIATQIFR
jgi:hypothetical protein